MIDEQNIQQERIQQWEELQAQLRSEALRKQQASSGITHGLVESAWKKWKWKIIMAISPFVFKIVLLMVILLVIVVLVALMYQCINSVSDAFACVERYGLGPLKVLFDYIFGQLSNVQSVRL